MAATAPATAPSRPRRARPAPQPAPRRRPAPRPEVAKRAARPRGAAFLDRLLRGRAWVWLIGTLLAGIVFLNVALLELSNGIARTTRDAAALGEENARLRLEAARLGSSERIQRAARARGLVMPAPGDVRYLRPGPDDGRLAARRITEPAPAVPVVDGPAVTGVAPATDPGEGIAIEETPTVAAPAAAGAPVPTGEGAAPLPTETAATDSPAAP